MVPESADQDIVVETINQVKAGHIGHFEQFSHMIDKYTAKGIKAFIGGCTEIPFLFPYLKGDFEKIDPTLLLAKAAVSKTLAAV